MSDTPNIDELRGLAEKLLHLLEEPEPGLFTWHEAVGSICREIAKYALPPAKERIS